MLWFAAHAKCKRTLLVKVACACARTALQYAPVGDDRPRLAIEAAERWAENPSEENQVSAALAATTAAAYAAGQTAFAAGQAAYAATHAAYAAAGYAAGYTATASTNADHAFYAAAASHVGHVGNTALHDMADIARGIIKIEDLNI